MDELEQLLKEWDDPCGVRDISLAEDIIRNFRNARLTPASKDEWREKVEGVVYGYFDLSEMAQDISELIDKILALLPTPDLSGIVHVGECPCPPDDYNNTGESCPKCNGTGEYRRDATLEEVLEYARDVIDSPKIVVELANGGTLRCKERYNYELTRRHKRTK